MTLVDPTTASGASFRNDGTNATVHLYATINQATGADPQIASVHFSYATAAAPTTFNPIATDQTAPYSYEWAPPAAGNYIIRAQAFEANNTSQVGSNSDQAVTVSDVASSVHISNPAEAGSVGYYDRTGAINVSGTRSTDGPAVSVTADGGAAGTAPAVAGLQVWAADAPLGTAPTGDTAGTTVNITQLAAKVTGSDEVIPATAYLQKLATFTISPDVTTQPNTDATYTVTAKDQKGNAISQLPFSLSLNNGSTAVAGTAPKGFNGDPATAYPAPVLTTDPAAHNHANLTDRFGTFKFTLKDANQATTTVTAESDFNGDNVKDNTVDFTTSAKLITVAQTPTAGVVTVTPNLPIYDTVRYGVSIPTVKVRINDQNGQAIKNSNANVVVTTKRTYTYCNGAPVTACQNPNPTTSTFNAGNTDANGDITIPVAAAVQLESAGTDDISLYFEKNGTPGFGTGDVTIPGVTLKFGPAHIYFQPCDQVNSYAGLPAAGCNAQAQVNSTKNLSVRYVIFDGTNYIPVAGRALDITIPAPGTPGDYELVAPRNSPTSVTATTDADGVAKFALTSKVVTTITVTASDPLLGVSETSENGTDAVNFRTYKATLNTVNNTNEFNITPTNFSGPANVGAPGQPLFSGVELRDQNGALLKNEVVTLTTTAGFFTPLPTGPDYSALTFDTKPADGDLIKGDLKQLGTTIQSVTDSNGQVFFTLGILRDSHFDVDGTVHGLVTASVGGTTQSLPVGQNGPNGAGAQPSVNGVLFSTDGPSYGVTPLNPSATQPVEIRQGTIDNNGKFHLGTGKPSGDVATAKDNGIPTDTPAFNVFLRDEFGNLVRSGGLNVTSTGVGSINQVGSPGAGVYNNVEGTSTYFRAVNAPSAAPQTGTQAVNADWTAPQNKWLVSGTSVTENNIQKTFTDSFSLNWYVRDPAAFKYLTVLTPSSVNGSNKAPTGTTVGVSTQVTDAKDRAVQGLPVQFFTAGPASETTHSNPCGSGFLTPAIVTDQSGKAGYQYASNTPGNSTITVVVDDNSCNELSRSVRTITFTQGTPTGTVPTLTISTNAINVGQAALVTVRGAAGSVVDLYALTRPGNTYQVVRHVTIDGSGQYTTAIRPRGNTRLFARTSAGDSTSVVVNVRPAMSLEGTVSGKTVAFSGTIVPGHGNVAVRIFTVKNGAITLVATTRTGADGHYSVSHTFASKGAVTFIAQTLSDSQNLSTQSNRITRTLG